MALGFSGVREASAGPSLPPRVLNAPEEVKPVGTVVGESMGAVGSKFSQRGNLSQMCSHLIRG